MNEYLDEFGLSDDEIERRAAMYEAGELPPADGPVMHGSHLKAVGKNRVTVVYDASDTQKVAQIAESRGIKPSDVYREALGQYLAAQ